MAIVQISRITQRKGLQDDLPALAGAEFGWSTDTRRLFIGNGTLAEGAPVVGNTEILTAYSDVLNLINYTYAGLAGGYVVDTGPTERPLQARLDDYANVKDFGAVGDGATDDTAAINRALTQLLMINAANPATRRSLFFPAGNYVVTDTIYIPPFVTIYGEGPQSSFLTLQSGTTAAYLLQTCDSMGQIGANIGTGGAIAPQAISVANMGFVTEDELDLTLIDSANNVSFTKCDFVGPMGIGQLTPLAADVACIRFAVSNPSFPVEQIEFNGCLFQGLTRGFNNDTDVTSVTVTNSEFNTLLQGAALGTTVSTQRGVRFTSNMFDNIAQEGLFFGLVSTCMSAYNIFLEVGNDFQGSGSPYTSCIEFVNGNNVSVGDMFERDDADNAVVPRIQINDQAIFAIGDNGGSLRLGTYTRLAGVSYLIGVNASPVTIFSFDTALVQAFKMEYQFEDSTNGTIRYGTMTAVSSGTSGVVTYNDDMTVSGPTGLTLAANQTGTSFYVEYTSTSSGILKYTITYQN